MNLTINEPFFSAFKEIKERLDNQDIELVGGFVRDSLLKRKTEDMDFATPVLPSLVHKAFPSSLYYPKFGTVSFKLQGLHVTVATYRKEKAYMDFRHPKEVTFITDRNEDSKRRDFTVNALYLALDGKIFDPTNQGISDIFSKTLRFISDPFFKVREDPLRILRAYRFKEELGFRIEPVSERAIRENLGLLSKLNPEKIWMELRKADPEIRKNNINELHLQPLLEKAKEGKKK